jgi:hypothetical protein
MGKSTCFNAILYALGLDAMITSRQAQLPLPHALSSKIYDTRSEQEVPVSKATVWLEFSHQDGNPVTVRRVVSGGPNQLVIVYEGVGIDDADQSTAVQMFVRQQGAATYEHGFARWLAENFLGWKLPKVERIDGTATQLYLETIFPLFFVEQKFGWARIQGNMPYMYRIRDVNKRATEFVLNLSLTNTEFERGELKKILSDLRSTYAASIKNMHRLAEIANCVLQGTPDAMGDAAIEPKLLVNTGLGWRDIDRRLSEIDTALASLDKEIAYSASSAGQQNLEARQRLGDLVAEIDSLRKRMRAETQEIHSLKRRTSSLGEQEAKLVDIRKLQSVGGSEQLPAANCPTCWQAIPDNIVPIKDDILSLENTIALVKGEKALIRSSIEESQRQLRAYRAEEERLSNEMQNLESAINVLADDPIQNERLERLGQVLSLRLERLTLAKVRERFQEYVVDTNSMIAKSQQLRAALDMLPVEFSEQDQAKLDALEEAFKEQERAYGFESFEVSELSISRENYRPSVGNFELSHETSASDGIRTIWAYLIALMETSRTYKDEHHIGLLMFDEPGQQSMSNFSFGQLLRHATVSGMFREQVIFFTSEKSEVISNALQQTKYHLHEFPGRLLLPL